jgi:hypothetical protein
VDFRIEHSLAAAPGRVAEVLLDQNYQAHLGDHLGVLAQREVLGQENLGHGRIRRRIRCVLKLHLSGAARRFLSNADPAYVETALWRPKEMTWQWTIDPEVAKDLIHAEGTIGLLPNGAGTSRVVEGVVRVRVPIFGGRVEGLIVEGLERAYGEEAERLRAWLDSSR